MRPRSCPDRTHLQFRLHAGEETVRGSNAGSNAIGTAACLDGGKMGRLSIAWRRDCQGCSPQAPGFLQFSSR